MYLKTSGCTSAYDEHFEEYFDDKPTTKMFFRMTKY